MSFPSNQWHLYALCVQRKYGVSPEWRVCGARFLDGEVKTFSFEGAVPIGVYQHGPRKGMEKWPLAKDCQTFTVTKAELEDFYNKWECETGICHKCMGKGKTPRRIPARSDGDYRVCTRCDGTGEALVVVEVASDQFADAAAFVRGEDMPAKHPEVAPPASVAAEPEARVRFTVDLPRSLHKRLKLAAVDRNLPMTDLVRQVLMAAEAVKGQSTESVNP